MTTGAAKGLIAIIAETTQRASVLTVFHTVASHSCSGYQMTASKKSGQPIAIRTRKPRLTAIARPGREIQVARASPTLVTTAP